MAGVRAVKNKMDLVSFELSNTTNDLHNLSSQLSSVEESNCNLLTFSVDRTNEKLTKIQLQLQELYRITSVELDVFFREYNSKLNVTINKIQPLKISLEELKGTAKTLYQLYLIDIAMEGFLEYNLSVQDLKIHLPKIRDFIKDVEVLKADTTLNNNKLVIKNNRG